MKLQPTGRPFPYLGERFEAFDDSGAFLGVVYAPASKEPAPDESTEPRRGTRRRAALVFAFGAGLLAGATIGPAAATTVRVAQAAATSTASTH